jgi:hypothetical protein
MTANLLSLDASLVIPTCVLYFEDSGLHRRTLVRLVLLTGQTGAPHQSDRCPLVRCCCTFILGFLVLALWINKCQGVKPG